MPFTSTLNPVAFSLGPVSIRYYGLVYALGFVFYIFYLKWLAKRKILELSDDDIYDLTFYLMLGTLIGGRLFSTLVWYPSHYFAHPLDIFKIWEGGMAFHGGFIGVVIAGWWAAREKKIPLGKLFDLTCIPFVLFLALGRLANFANGELYGPVTAQPWCVNFSGVEGCRHPYQIYSFLKRMAILPVLVFAYIKPHKDGLVFFLMTFLLGIGRFILDFWREDSLYYGLSVGQWSSIAMILVGGFVLGKYYSSDVIVLFRRTKAKAP